MSWADDKVGYKQTTANRLIRPDMRQNVSQIHWGFFMSTWEKSPGKTFGKGDALLNKTLKAMRRTLSHSLLASGIALMLSELVIAQGKVGLPPW